jgi:hypothetical protein
VTVLDTVYRAHPVTGELIIAGTDQPWRKTMANTRLVSWLTAGKQRLSQQITKG